MKQHPIEVLGYEGKLIELAHNVHSMRYDLVVEFYQQAARELRQQAASDRARGRVKLATSLEEAAVNVDKFVESMQRVWRICEPHMKHEIEQ